METPLTKNIRPGQEPLDLKGYAKTGGYEAARKALTTMTPQEVQGVVKDSTLRGRGGAGFPTGQKWSFVPMGDSAPHPKYLVANCDEMEPGTFKDRLLLENDPHQMIEGMIISAYAIQADVAYIFLRWAYKLSEERLSRAIDEAYEAGYLGKNIFGTGYNLEMHMHVSAGRYMCGEETGLLNSLEGKRATPRSKPPFPQVSGAWGLPTIVNNAETLCNVPHIIANGAEWFKALSKSQDGGHQAIRRERARQAAGDLGAAHGHDCPGDPRRIRRRHGRRLPVSRSAAGGRIHRLSDGTTPGRQDGFRLGAGGRQPPGHGHDDRARRPDVPGRLCGQPGAILCPGVLRLVHALPRGLALDRKAARRAGSRHGRAGRPGKAGVDVPGCLGRGTPSAPWRPAQSSLCRAR